MKIDFDSKKLLSLVYQLGKPWNVKECIKLQVENVLFIKENELIFPGAIIPTLRAWHGQPSFIEFYYEIVERDECSQGATMWTSYYVVRLKQHWWSTSAKLSLQIPCKLLYAIDLVYRKLICTLLLADWYWMHTTSKSSFS